MGLAAIPASKMDQSCSRIFMFISDTTENRQVAARGGLESVLGLPRVTTAIFLL
jgi:hypothetical protein